MTSPEIKSRQLAVTKAKRDLDKAKSDLLDQQLQELTEALGPVEVDIGTHRCDKSVIGICVYDADDDRCHDCCLFCKDPHERK